MKRLICASTLLIGLAVVGDSPASKGIDGCNGPDVDGLRTQLQPSDVRAQRIGSNGPDVNGLRVEASSR